MLFLFRLKSLRVPEVLGDIHTLARGGRQNTHTEPVSLPSCLANKRLLGNCNTISPSPPVPPPLNTYHLFLPTPHIPGSALPRPQMVYI